jgi:hypothetical protein
MGELTAQARGARIFLSPSGEGKYQNQTPFKLPLQTDIRMSQVRGSVHFVGAMKCENEIETNQVVTPVGGDGQRSGEDHLFCFLKLGGLLLSRAKTTASSAAALGPAYRP